MYKKYTKEIGMPNRYITKIWLIMRLTTVLLIATLMQVSASGLAQRVTLNRQKSTLEKIFRDIHKQTGFDFIYDKELLDQARPISIVVNNEPLEKVLEKCLENQSLDYLIEEKLIVIKKQLKSVKNNEDQVQKTDIKGKITDQTGKAVPGVNILIKGTNRGTSSDIDGNFSLSLATGENEIILSAIGFESQTLVINNQTNFSITLKESLSKLDEVVVVGYGKQSRAKIIGAVVAIDEEQLKGRGAANISALINGQSPGLTVLQRGGAPGRNAGTLNIRGIGSVDKSSSPLVIVDGIETGSITDINPNDVASISILKDASAAAIYGVRAANGVIIVTTKRGIPGRPTVTYSGQIGGSSFIRLPEKASSFDLASLYNEAQINQGILPANLRFKSEDLQKFANGSSPLTHANTNQVANIFTEAGIWNSHNLSVSGGNETGAYNVSVGYLNEGGIIKNAGLERYNFRANLDKKIGRKLSLGVNLSAAINDVTNPPVGAELLVHTAYREWPNDAAVAPDGRYINPAWSGLTHNALAFNDPSVGTNSNLDTRLIGTGFAEYKIIDGLNIKGLISAVKDNNVSKIKNIGVDLYDIDLTTGKLSDKPATNTLNNKSNPSVYRGFDVGLDINSQVLLNYEKTFGGKHYLKALLAFEQRNITFELNSLSRGGLVSPLLDQINAGDPNLDNTFGTIGNDYRSQAVFGNINYIYDDRYLFGASLRRDGVSRFAKNRRWGTFPSFSAGWRISKEPFFKISWVDELKLRASWGKLGNQDIGNYRFLSTYSLGSAYIFNNTLVNGVTEGSLGNPDISWESTSTSNFGLDITLFKGKFNLQADYFVKNTNGILLTPQSAAILGAAAPLDNSGKVKNSGFELILGYKDKLGDLNYYISANISKVKNEIVDITHGKTVFGQTAGLPLQNFMGYVADGLFQTQAEIDAHPNQDALGGNLKPGDIRYKDINGDGIINTDDRKLIGSPFPQINYGFSFGLGYKGFDFSMVWQGVADVQYNLAGTRLGNDLFWIGGAAPLASRVDRWQKEGDQTRYPRATFTNPNNGQSSTFWIENTSYLKLRNVQFGYNLPKSIYQKLGIQNVRFYLSGENLLTITPFKMDIDPEALSTGDPFYFRPGAESNNVYPTTNRYLAGLTVTF
jgi:TonB-linked SusC/RagA family outer membrane protein